VKLASRLQAAAVGLLPRFDTGYWSLYSLGGDEAPLEYHKYVVRLLTTLTRRTQDPTFAGYAQRFGEDLREPPVAKQGPAPGAGSTGAAATTPRPGLPCGWCSGGRARCARSGSAARTSAARRCSRHRAGSGARRSSRPTRRGTAPKSRLDLYARAAANLSGMAAMQDLVEEVERSYADTQARLSDPSVYNDHREAADVGRRLKELEAAHKLAREWLEASSDLEAARGDGDLRELVPELEERLE